MEKTSPKPFYKELYFTVALGIVAGVILGAVNPAAGEAMKPLGDGFIKLIRMMIVPVVFFTVVVGISSIGDMKKLGRVGLKALLYFELVSTVALGIGLVVVKVWQPGKGFNVDASTLDPKAVAQYSGSGQTLHTVDFLMNIIPETAAGAFARGKILQVLFLAILFGVALASFDGGKPIIAACDGISQVLFGIINIIMKVSPVGAFGAMAFTIGKYGLKAMLPLSQMLFCVYLTGLIFIVVVLGSIAKVAKFSLWKLLRFIREELVIVAGTSSSESALPGLIRKLEQLGCSRSVVGLVVPSGYSFNLDGTSIYLTIAAIFLAQATNTNLSTRDEIVLLLVLMLTSKGAAAVSGGGFITLAATLSSMGMVPVASIALLLGVDRFMSQMRSLVNLVGNAVATVVVARWENEFDAEKAERVLNRR